MLICRKNYALKASASLSMYMTTPCLDLCMREFSIVVNNIILTFLLFYNENQILNMLIVVMLIKKVYSVSKLNCAPYSI